MLVAFFAASDRLICKICAPHCDTFLSARHLTRASGACLRKRAACASIAPNVASCFVSKTNSRRSLNARETTDDSFFRSLQNSQRQPTLSHRCCMHVVKLAFARKTAHAINEFLFRITQDACLIFFRPRSKPVLGLHYDFHVVLL